MMGFTPLAVLKRQEEENRDKNSKLASLIFKNKKNKGKLKGAQIVRFGNDLLVAIYRPEGQAGGEDKIQKGSFGEVHTAYLIKPSSGEILETKFKVKFHKDTEMTLNDKGEEIAIEKKQGNKIDEGTGKTIIIPAITAKTQERRNKAIVEEAKADQITFSARVVIIPRKEKVNSQTVYETVILMTAIEGVSLDKFPYADFNFTPEKRLRLAINVIKAYENLHKKGKFHRDIKLNNIMIDPTTLEVTLIDRDISSFTPITRAPEDNGYSNYQPTPESEIYSLAQDVLSTILSGIRHSDEREHLPDAIGQYTAGGVNFRFSNRKPPQDKENDTSKKIKAILNKMRSFNPQARGTLKEAREGLEEQLRVITKNKPIAQDEEAIYDYQISLRQLDKVLQSSEYKIPEEYWMGDMNSTPNSKEKELDPIENAYNATVTETIFRLEELAAEIIRDSIKPHADIPVDKKVAEYNHHQRQLAILMKEETYLSLQVSEQKVAVLTCNTKTKESVGSAAKQATTTSIYILAETLEHFLKKPEKPKSDVAKPARTQSYSGSKLESGQKLSVLTKFKKEYDVFFKEKTTGFCEGIETIFNNIFGLLNNVLEGGNHSAFYQSPRKSILINSKEGQPKKRFSTLLMHTTGGSGLINKRG